MSLSVQFLKAGHCTHPEFVINPGGGLSSCEFPATVALIKHPNLGYCLFDTGYTELFYQATRRFPEKLYALITPVFINAENTAVHQLRQHGIAPEDIKVVIISHFHADHVSGLMDFPSARYLFLDDAYQHVMSLGRFRRVKAGFLKDLLPADFEKRARSFSAMDSIRLSSSLAPFEEGWDLFNDGSVIAVALPGHARGHMGLFVQGDSHHYFLVSDACWRHEQYLEHAKINPIAYLAVDNKPEYLHTLGLIHQYHANSGETVIVACHSEHAISYGLSE